MRKLFRLTPLAALLAGLAAPARAEPQATIADYMAMDVCVDAADAIIPNLVPGDAACARRRDLRPGETPPYELRNFLNPGGHCTEDGGTVAKLNRPVERGGQTRIVSSTLSLPVSPCGGARGRPGRPGEGGASIQWHDEGYGFIMGSYSPVALSVYQTPLCRDGSVSSRRFFRGWVIAPATVPAVGQGGFGVFESRLATGAASALPAACPTRYRRALTTWLVAPMRYTSDRELVSIVSSHFAQVSRDGLSPGATLQMEQTYWTREFGLSRWEKWAREDWVHPRSHRSAPDLARELRQRGRCGPAVGGTFDISSRTRFTDAPGHDDAYARAIVDPRSGRSQLWLMTLCEDYTNIRVRPAGKALPDASAIADPAYWRP
ncbi:hypothetical protein EV667_0928 [Ancylobacter aquaticus]|uniref:Uncharacterized protein n=1 Tax=Ancylobacter aquaticus TaxID=100 RepID=A0A4R1I637_ANCAQ|nr:hypothetical protein [Ancylobacter aquaticus]TCK30824.1 hypothetical protein EV667_0928 [Ancylobacter aquaticus]